MKLLIPGGAGYIGSHVTYEFCDQGYNVFVMDDLSTGFLNNIDKRAKFIQNSFSNEKEKYIQQRKNRYKKEYILEVYTSLNPNNRTKWTDYSPNYRTIEKSINDAFT